MDTDRFPTAPSRFRTRSGARSFCSALLCLSLTSACLGGGPAGPIPGSGFQAEAETRTTGTDWTAFADLDSVDIEIGGASTRTVRTGFVVFAGRPYLPVTWAPLKRWPDVVRAHPRVRVRVDGRVFAFDAREITNPERLARLRETGQAKYGAPFHARSLENSTFYFRLDDVGPE